MQKFWKVLGILTTLALVGGPLFGGSLVAPDAHAEEAEEDDVDAGQKKVEKKQSLLEAEKKVERKKKEDSDKLVKGEFNYEKLESLGFTKQEQELQFQKSKKRREIIQKTQELADKTTDRANLPDLYFRLAENWWEENHYEYLIERAEYNRNMDQWSKLPENRRPPKPVEPVENYAKSIDFYEKVLREYPGYKRIDEVLYRLGKAAMQQGKSLNNSVVSVNGVQYLNRLVQQHQASKYIPQAHLSLAEYYFESNKLTQAKMNYEKIVQNFANSPMYNYALYKLGWVYYNLREFRRTIDTFKQVVQKISGNSNKGVIEFRDQALKDLVSAFAELDHGWPEAKEYFKGAEGEDKMWTRLEKMAEIYVAADKDDNAIELFSHFIENHPTDLRCVDWHESIVDVRKKSGSFPDVEKAMRTFLAFTDDRTSPWVQAAKRAAAKGEEPLEKAAKMGENYLLFISNEYHQQAQKLEEQTKMPEKARPLYATAAKDYQEFVRRFPQSKKACIVNFYYAEILYDQLKDFKASNEGYKAVLQRCPGGEFEEDAALGVIYSVQQLMAKEHARWDAVKGQWVTDPTAPPLMTLQEETTTFKTKKDKKEELTEDQIKAAKVPQKRQELHPMEKDYVDAADTYVKLMFEAQKRCKEKKKDCGKGKQVPEIMYVGASVYYDRGQYDLAKERFEKVYNYQPENRVAEIAIKTIIDIHARHKEWPQIEDWARKMLARKTLVVFDRKDLRKYVAVAVASQALELAEKKDFDGAHKKYDTILAEFKKEEPEMAATAMFNKAEIFRLQKEDLKAIKQYEQVVKEFPKSKVGPEAMFEIGVLYESMTQFKDAADAFVNMAKFRDNAQAAQALINAGAILKALQQYKDAVAAFEKFQSVAANLKGDDPRSAELKGLIGDAEMEKGHVLEKMGGEGLGKAAAVYAGITAKFGARPDLQVEALGRKAETLRLANDGKDAGKNRKDVLKAADAAIAAFAKPEAQKGMAAFYAAQAQFYKAEYDFDDFDVLSLKTVKKMSQLGPVLQKKAEALKKAEKTYLNVFDVAAAGGGRAYAAAAMFRIGLLYFKFKDDLFNAPVPPQVSANPDLEQEYRQVVERMAQPIEEQALTALRNAINVAHNLGVYNKWSKEAGEYAAKVSPEEYPTVEKDPNLPKATTAVSANKQTDVATSAAFVFNVRRGKFTVSYKPEAPAAAKDAPKDAGKKDEKKDEKAPAGK